MGHSVRRLDAEDKVHGRTRFTDDLRPPGCLHTAVLTSPLAHARILSIDKPTIRVRYEYRDREPPLLEEVLLDRFEGRTLT